MVPSKDPAWSQGQPMGCVPLIPVLVQSVHCPEDICSSSSPTKGNWESPSLACVCCMLREGRSNGDQGAGSAGVQDEGHKQGCMRCQGWSRGPREGRQGQGHGQGTGRVSRTHTVPHCVLTFLPQCGLAGRGVRGSSSPRRPVLGHWGHALPVSAWTSPCLAVTLPCAAACTGHSSVNHVAKCLGCVLFVGSQDRAGAA